MQLLRTDLFFFKRKLNPEYIPASTKTHFVPRYFAISSTFRQLKNFSLKES